MVVKLKTDLDQVFKLQQYFQRKYKEVGLDFKDKVYICKEYIMYIYII
jgi:hypothetical protein